jgi:hypothetical protein
MQDYGGKPTSPASIGMPVRVLCGFMALGLPAFFAYLAMSMPVASRPRDPWVVLPAILSAPATFAYLALRGAVPVWLLRTAASTPVRWAGYLIWGSVALGLLMTARPSLAQAQASMAGGFLAAWLSGPTDTHYGRRLLLALLAFAAPIAAAGWLGDGSPRPYSIALLSTSVAYAVPSIVAARVLRWRSARRGEGS